MKIGIDISQVVYQGTGVGRFMSGLTKSIVDYDKKNHWVFFFSSLRKGLPSDLENGIKKRGFKLIKHKIPPTFLNILWNDFHALNVETLIGKCDWFISSDWTEPPSSIKKATVVHDLTYLRYPETVDNKILNTQKKRLERVKKESRLIIADSQTTKNDLIELLGMNEGKIKVNYPGVEIIYPQAETVKKTLNRYRLDKPFILTVGKIEPRKNFNKLIEAYAKLGQDEVDLVIVGQKGWGEQLNLPRLKTKNIHHLAFINDQELFALYSSCLFFAYPSIWEGFGYPIIEAMKLGKAVIASNASSIKEIADGAALLFDPLKVEEITNAMKKMNSDEKLRDELAVKGKERAMKFTWEKYVQRLLSLLA